MDNFTTERIAHEIADQEGEIWKFLDSDEREFFRDRAHQIARIVDSESHNDEDDLENKEDDFKDRDFDDENLDLEYCEDESNGFLCGREEGHVGPHAFSPSSDIRGAISEMWMGPDDEGYLEALAYAWKLGFAMGRIREILNEKDDEILTDFEEELFTNPFEK